MANNSASINVNRDVLVEKLGLRQYKITTVYTKKRVFVISPSSQNWYSWFDVRKVNLDSMTARKRMALISSISRYTAWADLDQFVTSLI
jgi:hypothetical protein